MWQNIKKQNMYTVMQTDSEIWITVAAYSATLKLGDRTHLQRREQP